MPENIEVLLREIKQQLDRIEARLTEVEADSSRVTELGHSPQSQS